MSLGQSQAVPKPLQFLLETGSMAGMPDAQLVERFAASRDAAGEAAFALLVSRHGPMVLGACRQLLDEPHTAEDAFQAVFMVLARRAGSIRRPDLLAPWLHGVATRIARKASAQARLRRRREKSEVEMLHIESVSREADARSLRDESAAAVHEELVRLTERYRRAVVLCHFEGLTHAEAARRLGCDSRNGRITRNAGARDAARPVPPSRPVWGGACTACIARAKVGCGSGSTVS